MTIPITNKMIRLNTAVEDFPVSWAVTAMSSGPIIEANFPENVVETEEFIGVALWHQLGEIRTAQGLNAALRGSDKHSQYPEIKRCLQKIGVYTDNHINNDPNVEHCFSRKAFCQFSVYNGKRCGDDLGDKQDDQEACGADP